MKRRNFFILSIASLIGTKVVNSFSASAQNSLAGESGLEEISSNLNLLVLGHEGHGKTTLTSAITKVQSLKNLATFRAYEELDNASTKSRARGLPINISQVEYETDSRHYQLFDMPTRQDYIKVMITGSIKIDAAILVVSAADGPMSQTREHLLLARELGASSLVVFLNKLDLVDDLELIELVELEVRELLSEYSFSGEETPIVSGSALLALQVLTKNGKTNPKIRRGENEWVDKLLDLINQVDEYLPVPEQLVDKPFLMAVEDVFSITGRGTVATGRIERGTVKVGDSVELVGMKDTLSTTVIAVEMFQKTLDQGLPGDNISVWLQ